MVNASDPDSHKRIVTNRKGYKLHVQQWLALRALNPDITNTEAAERIGIVRTTLQHSIRRAVDEGWLVFTDPLEQVDYQIVPKVVKNLNYFLDQQDHKVTIETAKGVLFPAYRESKGITENAQAVLALKIEMPAAVPNVIDITADTQIIGQPKDHSTDPIEAEVNDQEV